MPEVQLGTSCAWPRGSAFVATANGGITLRKLELQPFVFVQESGICDSRL